ncbi:MAG: DUF2723 domain-containing protein [Ignavibacteriales bacterium]|nr:DUF2723 domain-containing protein [Ignavibacteriales bacterium]
MNDRKLNRIIALGLFFVSLAVYVKTLSPTVAFWDVGEFMAAAYYLQVPHPPGAPLFLLIARIFSEIPLSSDIAVRMHFISALASAATVMFLYLISVRFMTMWRGKPEATYDKVVIYGSAVIGALSFAFSKTFWFNAVEAEVYGLSMLFVSSILWLALRWYEKADWQRGDVYLLLIAYMIGMSVGVHLLAILTLFSVMLLVYYRSYDFSPTSFVKFGAVAVLVFGVIYPGVVKVLPSLLDGEFGGNRSEVYTFIPIVALGGALYGIYRSIKLNQRIVNVALLSFLLIVLGYSTYTMVYIRANAGTPMNENNPNDLTRLVSYLNREQYGTAPLIDRRWNTNEPDQAAAHQRYSSDWDYFWRYQLNHMYLRYFGWNYVGVAGDWKEAGVDWSKLYGIPLLIGLFGAFHHWSKDWKMASVGVTLFLIMGVVLVVYFNMQEPQPRERDYFYVASFFVFSMWIGMGVLGLVDEVRERFFSPTANPAPAAYAVLAFSFAFVPANMARVNFHEANRTGNYVAWDYSYNLLQSCDKDAILFTNGDNDTFPLWYLQDVEGIRRDIRIANLSLLNTNWYIHQLKNLEPYGAKKVPISIPDSRIENITPIFPYQATSRELAVPKPVIDQYGVNDTSLTNRGAIAFTLSPTISIGQYSGLRVQDIMVYDIIRTSGWERPIYFAMTVSDDGKIGLREYMQLEGLAFKLVPRRGPYWETLDSEKMWAHFFTDIERPSKEPQVGFLWRGLRDSTTYFDEDVRRLMTNYRQAFFSLGYHFTNVKNQKEKFARILDRMEEVIPRSVIKIPLGMRFDIANYYQLAGRQDQYRAILEEVIQDAKPVVDRGEVPRVSQDNPYILLLQAYEGLERYDKALELLDVIRRSYSAEPGVEEFVSDRQRQILSETGLRDSLAGRSPLP